MTATLSTSDRTEARSELAATRLVAEREIKSTLRMKGFWVGLVIMLLAIFAVSILPSVFGGKAEVAAVGNQAEAVLQNGDLDVRTVADEAEARQLVEDEEVEAAVVPDQTGKSPAGVRVVALSEPPTDVLGALTTAPPVDLLEQAEVHPAQKGLVITAFGLVFMMFGMGGIAIAQGTITEKQTRIVEILVATIPIRALLMGKIAGHTLMTIGQVVLMAVAAPIALRLGGHSELTSMIAPAIGWFVPFLCLGFVLLGAMWAVVGSMVSRQEDLGSSMGPVMILVMGPYFAVIALADNATAMTVLSYVPFSAPSAMPARMFTGDAEPWEALLSMGILAATAAAVVLFASRLYAGSLLQTGGKVKLTKAWSARS